MKFVTPVFLAEEHEVSIDTVYGFAAKFKDEPFIKHDGKKLFIDMEYLEKHKENYIKMWNAAHEYYYYITYTLGISAHKLAKGLSEYAGTSVGSWDTYMSNALWSRIDDKSILSIHRPKQLLEFLEFCEYAIPRLKKNLKNKKRCSIC